MDDSIAQYLNADSPFGPIDSSIIDDPKAFISLFSQHNEMYKRLLKRPMVGPNVKTTKRRK